MLRHRSVAMLNLFLVHLGEAAVGQAGQEPDIERSPPPVARAVPGDVISDTEAIANVSASSTYGHLTTFTAAEKALDLPRYFTNSM